MPLLGQLADAEWVHWLFVALAVPASLFGLRPARLGAAPPALVGAAVGGLGLLIAGAAEAGGESFATPLTLLGAISLATAHVLNWRRHARHGHTHN